MPRRWGAAGASKSPKVFKSIRGRSARVPLPKLGPCLSGGPNHWAVNRGNTPERTPHLVLGVESASVGYNMRPQKWGVTVAEVLYIYALCTISCAGSALKFRRSSGCERCSRRAGQLASPGQPPVRRVRAAGERRTHPAHPARREFPWQQRNRGHGP